MDVTSRTVVVDVVWFRAVHVLRLNLVRKNTHWSRCYRLEPTSTATSSSLSALDVVEIENTFESLSSSLLSALGVVEEHFDVEVVCLSATLYETIYVFQEATVSFYKTTLQVTCECVVLVFNIRY